jgi:hypothetical protein
MRLAREEVNSDEPKPEGRERSSTGAWLAAPPPSPWLCSECNLFNNAKTERCRHAATAGCSGMRAAGRAPSKAERRHASQVMYVAKAAQATRTSVVPERTLEDVWRSGFAAYLEAPHPSPSPPGDPATRGADSGAAAPRVGPSPLSEPTSRGTDLGTRSGAQLIKALDRSIDEYLSTGNIDRLTTSLARILDTARANPGADARAVAATTLMAHSRATITAVRAQARATIRAASASPPGPTHGEREQLFQAARVRAAVVAIAHQAQTDGYTSDSMMELWRATEECSSYLIRTLMDNTSFAAALRTHCFILEIAATGLDTGDSERWLHELISAIDAHSRQLRINQLRSAHAVPAPAPPGVGGTATNERGGRGPPTALHGSGPEPAGAAASDPRSSSGDRGAGGDRGGRSPPSGPSGGGGAAADDDPMDGSHPTGGRVGAMWRCGPHGMLARSNVTRCRTTATGPAAAAPNEGNQETSTANEDAANPVRRDRA